MRKLFTFLVAVLLTASVFAQSPEKMNYQAVIRDASDNLITSTQVGMQISILQGSASGTAVYVETQEPTTNANGLVSIEIGTGATSDDFSAIDWANGPYFIKTETDPTGGTTYTITGTSQLLSVPYAFHAKTAETVTGGISETDPVYSASEAANITATDITSLGNLSGVNTGDQDGSETKVTSGTNVTVTGSGTTASPYVVNSNSGVTTYSVGDFAHGGIVFYVEPCGTKGLVVATEDQSTGIKWRGGSTSYNTMARGDEVYAGKMNTSIIISIHSAKDDFDDHAASVCANYDGGDFGDWYLPSKEELLLIYNNLHTQGLGGFISNWYWSSSEHNANSAWSVNFNDGITYNFTKGITNYVRAVRAF